MNQQELLSRQRAFKREEDRVSIVWLIAFFGTIFSQLPAAKWMNEHKSAFWIHVAWIAFLLVFTVGNLYLGLWVMKRRIQRYGLMCPACGKSLAHAMGRIAVITGKCGHCGAMVLDEPSKTLSQAKE